MKQKQKNKTSTFSFKSLQLIRENKAFLHSLLNKGLACMIFILMIAYIISINDLSIKGFISEDLKNKINKLESENEQYELKAMALESYEQIDERAQKLGMIKVDDIEYLSVVTGAVAVK